MAKKQNGRPERDRLLGLITDALLQHGAVNFTLSSLSRAVGSNNRMILYYFTSKEAAITEGVLQAYSRCPRLATLMTNLDGKDPLVDRLERTWRELRHEDNVEFLRLYLEVLGTAARTPGSYPTFVRATIGMWPPSMVAAMREDGYSPRDADILAKQIHALWRGLQFDLVVGEDPALLDEVNSRTIRALVSSYTASPTG